jgi:hypothetical protein
MGKMAISRDNDESNEENNCMQENCRQGSGGKQFLWTVLVGGEKIF